MRLACSPGAGALAHHYTSHYVPNLLEDLKQLSLGGQSRTVERASPDRLAPGPCLPPLWLCLPHSSWSPDLFTGPARAAVGHVGAAETLLAVAGEQSSAFS